MDLNKKRAEWAGFRFVNYCRWLYPDGTYHKELPNFPEDETACLKWLMPKLQGEWDFIDLNWDVGAWDINLTNYTTWETFYLGEEVGETFESLALALCKAIEKLIK